ncbi:penicillin acylase family protein [Chroogloeocystis siderophila]|uniref:Uncharacterized protein n=1 Tax=Chroogloeocystis siderophila 5.2 s.c.1 TaxID=247279 RepID=A0A1U7HXY3_9CHRO|nr:penicillin acylase family protein [Chroogloeocystis siderophila]OKH28425.1 hypothetical protein NIES1031_04080 [Chroogloeocystis siderophila 5.2 s.c.1]
MYGALNVHWGDVFQLEYGNQKLPGNGGLMIWACSARFGSHSKQTGSFTAIGGDSYVAAIEFSNPIRAMTLNSYGNSTQPNSQHNGDQLIVVCTNAITSSVAIASRNSSPFRGTSSI